MSYRFEHDPQSGAFYVRVREGEYRETIPLADEPGFGAGVDVDGEGNVLGFEFLSFEEYAELLARSGGTLEVPDVVENRESPLSLEEPESPDTILDAAISSLPPGQQTFLRLYFEEGYTMAEISKMVGSSEDVVRARMTSAINAVRRELATVEEDDSLQLEERLEKVLRGGQPPVL